MKVRVGKVDEKSVKLGIAVGINVMGGYLSKQDGRVRLLALYDKFPGSHRVGSALRSRVIWWLNTGDVIRGLEANIHHKNHDRSDDRFENLEKLSHVDHLHLHNPKGLWVVDRVCTKCQKQFKIDRWRLRDPARGRFCSQTCYQAFPKRKRTRIVE